jgi:hypothetical protein
LNAILTRSCGFCGSQQAVCLAGGDGGGGKVSDYSTCTGEVANGCAPGTSATEVCGLCGTHQKICQNNCQWAAGSCTGEPVGACTPGVVTNTGAGCSAGSYRQQTCGNDCKLGNVSVSCGPFMNPVTLQVPAAVNGVVSHTQDLEIVAGQTFSLSTGTCPSSTVKADYPTDYVEVDNNTGKTAKLTIYQSATPGGTELDTVLFIYNGSAPPTTDPTKLACTGSIADSCSSTALCGSMSTFTFASQTGVTVAPGGKILVYSGGYFNDVTGPMMINVRTDSLN